MDKIKSLLFYVITFAIFMTGGYWLSIVFREPKETAIEIEKPKVEITCPDTLMTEPIELRESLADSIRTGKIKIRFVLVGSAVKDSIKFYKPFKP